MNSAAEFLATGTKFKLGFLETERPHPSTLQLSDLAQNDISKGVETLVEIDVQALERVKAKISQILKLQRAIQTVRSEGGRIYLCGCGATGRLSLTLETLYRESHSQSDDVIAFMAGGDVALVHSLEGFEDFPEYGERQLRELGFGERDLLIASSEGGETPYVIGAVEGAAKISRRAPYFLYCNPDDLLSSHVERSRRVIENTAVEKINLSVGPMALAGSTRMQASTVLQLAIGFALLTTMGDGEIAAQLERLQQYLRQNAVAFLPAFIEREAGEYLDRRYVLYRVKDYAITVFTDTTERAPTFSLTPFSHRGATRLLRLKPSLCYISLPQAKTADEAWKVLLAREPRSLNWLDKDERTGESYLRAFDFSSQAGAFRSWLTEGAEHSDFEIFRHQDTLLWRFQDVERSLIWGESSHPLFEHTLLKMFLNIHSTLIMGRLGRYKRNLMTWVYPTNGKLIDRAARYAQTLLNEDGVAVSYESVVEEIFRQKAGTIDNNSIVLAVYEALRGKKTR